MWSVDPIASGPVVKEEIVAWGGAKPLTSWQGWEKMRKW
jgi:hypothetical protein